MANGLIPSRLCLPSPAKLNLFLHINARRSDGYHNIQTAFQFLDFGDELEFETRSDRSIHVTMSDATIAQQDNLIFKAASLLQAQTDCHLGANIYCRKKIPLGAGLGGGSSNAATTLLALNYLWESHLDSKALRVLARTLGADVPIFMYGQAAWAEGVGDQLQPINVAQKWYLLLLPPCQISTAKIFSDPELTRNTPKITIQQFLSDAGQNDCEKIVKRHYPIVNQAIECLSQYAPAKLTGTGSAVFAAFDSAQEANDIGSRLSQPFRYIVTKGLNESPLHKTIAKNF